LLYRLVKIAKAQMLLYAGQECPALGLSKCCKSS